MSLKAKIEAVIYASEDPVTLAQLAGLLGQETQAELDRTSASQQTLDLGEAREEGSLGENFVDGDADSPDKMLERVAAVGAARTRAIREHTASDEAAMNTADSLDMEQEAPAADDEVENAVGNAPAQPASDTQKESEKRLAREARELERRLRDYLRSILEELIADYATSERGLEIREVAGGYRLATKPEYHDAVRGFVKSLKPALKLTLQALETLAVVAYKQPVTAPEVSEIRGVDSGGVLGSLMTRKLVATAGRKQVIGRPILYKTTKDFLLRFGLKDIHELPSIEEFEKMAGEFADHEELPMMHHAPETAEELEQERGGTEAQADGDGSTAGETAGEEAIVDGRLSGLPPSYDEENAAEAGHSPALDAEIQSEEKR